jgi:hypothetical protein
MPRKLFTGSIDDNLSEIKTRFKSAGFATYRDIEQLAIQLLERADLATVCARISLRYPLL